MSLSSPRRREQSKRAVESRASTRPQRAKASLPRRIRRTADHRSACNDQPSIFPLLLPRRHAMRIWIAMITHANAT